MPWTPLDSGLMTSTLLKEGPDVVAIWALLMASADKVGESVMTPSSAASLLRISDDRAKAAWLILTSPDPESRNQEYGGRRMVPTEGGKWFLTSHEKYQHLASRAAATERQRKYEARQAAKATKKAKTCAYPQCAANPTKYGSYCEDHERDAV